MSREEAIEKLSHPALSDDEVRKDFSYIATKLGIDESELQLYLEMPLKSYKDYPNQEWFFNFGAKVFKFLGIERSIKR